MEKSINEWNTENEEQYTLRGCACYKEDKEARIMIAAINEGEYDLYERAGITIKALMPNGKLCKGIWKEHDDEAMEKDYRGSNLIGTKGDIGIRKSTQIAFK
ncbi:hypothetical protein DFP73DRAFT_601679 [Morchella snyderi]|nr:hypothetical protein DFP73DRAFT_601679 [Morchella snyderi]